MRILILFIFLIAVGCAIPDLTEQKMPDEELLEKASTIAFKKREVAGGRFENLDEPFRTIAVVYSAQGIIDNGGLIYFFEADWPYIAYISFYGSIDRYGFDPTDISNAILRYSNPKRDEIA